MEVWQWILLLGARLLSILFSIANYAFLLFDSKCFLILDFVVRHYHSDPKGEKAAAKAKQEAAAKKKKKAAAGGTDALDDLLNAGLAKGKGKKKK